MTSSAAPADMSAFIDATCLCLAVQRASRAVGRRFDEAFRPLGITNWQFSLLTMLHRPAALTVGGLAAQLGMDRTTITSNLKPLQRRGLLTIAADPQDRRVRRIALTDAGRALLEAAAVHWHAANAEVEGRLAEVDPITLRAALRELAVL